MWFVFVTSEQLCIFKLVFFGVCSAYRKSGHTCKRMITYEQMYFFEAIVNISYFLPQQVLFHPDILNHSYIDQIKKCCCSSFFHHDL